MDTVTLTTDEVVTLPAASRATALRLWAPLVVVVVFHEILYGAVVSSAPRLAPSSLNCTPTTPTLSEALAETVIVPATVPPAAGAVIETVGCMASTPVTVRLAVAVLPAASCAVTVSTFVPSWRAIPLAVQLVVPLAVPLPPRLLAHVTWVTPTLSDAVPPNIRGELPVLYVDAEVGEVMAMMGGVVSAVGIA